MQAMQQILKQTQELKDLMNAPTTIPFSGSNIFYARCVVCDQEIEEGEKFCSMECAEIHSYDIVEAEATGN